MSAAKHRYVNTVKHLLQHPDINCNLIDKVGRTSRICLVFLLFYTSVLATSCKLVDKLCIHAHAKGLPKLSIFNKLFLTFLCCC